MQSNLAQVKSFAAAQAAVSTARTTVTRQTMAAVHCIRQAYLDQVKRAEAASQLVPEDLPEDYVATLTPVVVFQLPHIAPAISAQNPVFTSGLLDSIAAGLEAFKLDAGLRRPTWPDALWPADLSARGREKLAGTIAAAPAGGLSSAGKERAVATGTGNMFTTFDEEDLDAIDMFGTGDHAAFLNASGGGTNHSRPTVDSAGAPTQLAGQPIVAATRTGNTAPGSSEDDGTCGADMFGSDDDPRDGGGAFDMFGSDADLASGAGESTAAAPPAAVSPDPAGSVAAASAIDDQYTRQPDADAIDMFGTEEEAPEGGGGAFDMFGVDASDALSSPGLAGHTTFAAGQEETADSGVDMFGSDDGSSHSESDDMVRSDDEQSDDVGVDMFSDNDSRSPSPSAGHHPSRSRFDAAYFDGLDDSLFEDPAGGDSD